MGIRRMMAMVAALLAIWCFAVTAAEEPARQSAEKPPETPPISATVVGRDGSRVALRAFEIVGGGGGLFGSSSERLDVVPVKTGDMLLDVPLDKLTKIEILSADNMGKTIRLRLTSSDGKTLDAVLDADKRTTWKGTHPFADSAATLDLTRVREIVLQEEKK